jgi:hypothetical protein
MGTRKMTEVSEKASVSFVAMVSGAVSSSIEGCFVSCKLNKPDLYSQKN